MRDCIINRTSRLAADTEIENNNFALYQKYDIDPFNKYAIFVAYNIFYNLY